MPRMMPKISVPPIFLTTDQQMATGRKWNTASPISHKKSYMPAQNWEVSASERVPSSNRLTSPIKLRKPRIRPPTIRAGISGAKISARLDMARCRGFWLVLAACLAASLLTPSMPETLVNSS